MNMRRGLSWYRELFQDGTKYKAQGTGKMDIIMLGIGVLFFAVSLAYVRACDRI